MAKSADEIATEIANIQTEMKAFDATLKADPLAYMLYSRAMACMTVAWAHL